MLAIVIPAYRPQFLQLALNSIAAQTNKNFKCYIFDDAAPKEIKSISDNFPDFYYTRFNENMGRHDLVGHWHRCLESVKEEWMWLFSDDDIMAPNCVEEYYKTLNLYPNATVFRFPRTIIDANGHITSAKATIKNETGLEFLESKLMGQGSCLQDHIFNWKKLKEINGGLVNFPLAWCSDDATWCLLGKIHEIIAISSAYVQIRNSGINITSKKDIETLKIKLYALMLFYLWCSKNFNLPFSYKLKFIRLFVRFNGTIPFLHFFQLPIFHNPILILVILLVPIRKLYKMLEWFGKASKLLTRGK
jgi:glycosyltransferase involved in cell wall biosynthesis